MFRYQKSINPVIRIRRAEFPRGTVETEPVLKYVSEYARRAQDVKRAVLEDARCIRRVSALFRIQRVRVNTATGED